MALLLTIDFVEQSMKYTIDICNFITQKDLDMQFNIETLT